MPQDTFKTVIRDAVFPGLGLGLCAPTLITREVSAYLQLLTISVPAGILLTACFCWGLRLLLARGGAAPAQINAALAHVTSPLMLLALGCAVFVFPIPALPFFVAAAVTGTVYYRIFTVLRRLCSYQTATLECYGLLIPFGIAFFLLFQVNIIHDAFQYLCLVISLIKDFDLNFYNEVYLLNIHRFYNPVALHSARYLGVPLLETPFFVAGEMLARLMRVAGAYHIPNGMSFPYLFMVSLASPLFGLGAVLLMYLLCREFFSRSISLLATVGYFLASPLIFFVFCWNGWPHPFNTFFIALFLLYWKRTAGRKQLIDWVALGSLGGILCLIRPTNAIIALFPLWEIAADFRQQREHRGPLCRGAAAGLLAAVLVFSPQFTIWKGTGGKFLSGPYQEIGDYFDWLHPDFWGTLFATAQHGLFAWTPLLLPAALGLAFFVKKDCRFGLLAVLTCVLHAYIYSCWSVWWTGIGFSNRFFIELSPLLVLGLAALMEKAMQKVLSRDLVVVICSLFAVWNLFLIGEYRTNSVPYGIPDPARVIDKPLTMGTIIYNHLFVFPQNAGSLFTSQWSNDTFFPQRIIQALSYQQPVKGALVLVAAAICCIAFYLVTRAVFSRSLGKRLRRTLKPLLWAAGALVVLIHVCIIGAYRHTMPFSHIHRFELMFKAVRQPAEDTWFYSTYHYPVIRLDLLTYLIYGFEIPQDEPVAVVSVYDQSDRRFDYVLRAGVDTAEHAYLRPGLWRSVKHTVAQTAMVRETSDYLSTYVTHLQFPEPIRIRKIGIRYLRGSGELIIADMFARDF